MKKALKILFVPSCGIGYDVLSDGRWVVKQNNLTPVDTKIRCDKAAELFNKGKADIIFCTGGIFLPPNLQTKPASYLMKNYLFSHHNISPERIWTEEVSLDSWQNVEEMRKVLRKNKVEIDKTEIIVVSHWTHTIRLKRIFRYNGFRKIQRYGLDYHIGWRMYISEILNNILTILDPAGKSIPVQKARKQRKQD